MNLKNDPQRWGPVSQLLHWLVVALIILQGALGLWMVGMLNSPDKIRMYALHKSLGLTVLALALVRLAWRAWAGAPRPVPGTPGWQMQLARAGHGLLYILLLAIPISGWVFNSAAGFPLQFFGLFNLPAITAIDTGLREAAISAHLWLFWTLVVVALGHAGAAFYHHLFMQDATLARMLPRGWLQTGEDHTDA